MILRYSETPTRVTIRGTERSPWINIPSDVVLTTPEERVRWNLDGYEGLTTVILVYRGRAYHRVYIPRAFCDEYGIGVGDTALVWYDTETATLYIRFFYRVEKMQQWYAEEVKHPSKTPEDTFLELRVYVYTNKPDDYPEELMEDFCKMLLFWFREQAYRAEYAIGTAVTSIVAKWLDATQFSQAYELEMVDTDEVDIENIDEVRYYAVFYDAVGMIKGEYDGSIDEIVDWFYTWCREYKYSPSLVLSWIEQRWRRMK